MADTQRTRTQILSLLADNVVGAISAQDFRDIIVTLMEEEYANPGDFWSKPQAKFTLTDKTARGAKMYSQYMGSDVSWMNVLHMEASTGYWMRADIADSAKNGKLALAMDSYASDVSTATVLVEGIVYDSSFSTIFSELIGRPIWLDSGVPGSISVGSTDNSVQIVGFIMPSDDHGGSAIGKWYFGGKVNWSVKGS